MFSFDHIITREFVLARITQYDIFARYLGHYPQLGMRYTNPLPGRGKKDTHADCQYYESSSGKLLFKDWAYAPPGKSAWDCFDVVQGYYGCSFYRALEHIVADFGLVTGGVAIPATINPDEQIPYAKTVLTRSEYVPIQVKRKEWSDQELAYWQMKDQEVTIDQLECNRIFPLSHFWWDGWCMGYNLQMCFGYQLGVPDKWQIYQPLCSDKRYKFRQSSSSWVHGFSFTDPDAKYIICTKSCADRFYLSLCGYNVVNVLSESHNFSQQQIDQLNQYKNVILCYDSDSVGRTWSAERAEENRWKRFEFPDTLCKDAKECAQRYGADRLREVVDTNLGKLM